jgi:hypothetical protein
MLNLSNSGGSNAKFIRFSPQANAWSNSEGEFELKKFVFDVDNVQTGWMLIAVGTYEFVADETLGKKGAQPSPEHKRGFKVQFYNKEMGLCEWSANGVGHNMALEELYTTCAKARADNEGKLPVVEYKGSRAEKIGKGTTRIANFVVTNWIARPAGMDEPPQSDADFIKSVMVKNPVPIPVPPQKAVVDKAFVSDDEIF